MKKFNSRDFEDLPDDELRDGKNLNSFSVPASFKLKHASRKIREPRVKLRSKFR